MQAKLEAYPEPVEGLRDRPAGMRALRNAGMRALLRGHVVQFNRSGPVAARELCAPGVNGQGVNPVVVRGPFGTQGVTVRLEAANHTFLARGKQALSVRTVNQRERRRPMPANDAHHSADFRLPDAKRSVIAGRSAGAEWRVPGSQARDWSENKSIHGFQVMSECAQEAAVVVGPNLEGAVGAGRDDRLSRRTEGDGRHRSGMPGKGDSVSERHSLLRP